MKDFPFWPSFIMSLVSMGESFGRGPREQKRIIVALDLGYVYRGHIWGIYLWVFQEGIRGTRNIENDKPCGLPVFIKKFSILKCWNHKDFNKTGSDGWWLLQSFWWARAEVYCLSVFTKLNYILWKKPPYINYSPILLWNSMFHVTFLCVAKHFRISYTSSVPCWISFRITLYLTVS